MTQPLDPELEAGLRRLRLRGMRELAPELLQTAKTQRWPPAELLGTLVREELASRDASNERARIKAAGFPAHKTLDGFDLKASQLPRPTFEFLASLEWLDRNDNLCLAGPAGIGKSHLPKLGRAAITAGKKVRFFGVPTTSLRGTTLSVSRRRVRIRMGRSSVDERLRATSAALPIVLGGRRR